MRLLALSKYLSPFLTFGLGIWAGEVSSLMQRAWLHAERIYRSVVPSVEGACDHRTIGRPSHLTQSTLVFL